jgi:two-component system, cell cycle sensor histidine kinase DivJ
VNRSAPIGNDIEALAHPFGHAGGASALRWCGSVIAFGFPCVTALALGAVPMPRTGPFPLGLEEDPGQMLAGDMTDVITRHRRDGRVLFALLNAPAALGVPAGDLMGLGLFGCVQVADRPAYLKALSDSAATGITTRLPFDGEGAAAGAASIQRADPAVQLRTCHAGH